MKIYTHSPCFQFIRFPEATSWDHHPFIRDGNAFRALQGWSLGMIFDQVLLDHTDLVLFCRDRGVPPSKVFFIGNVRLKNNGAAILLGFANLTQEEIVRLKRIQGLIAHSSAVRWSEDLLDKPWLRNVLPDQLVGILYHLHLPRFLQQCELTSS